MRPSSTAPMEQKGPEAGKLNHLAVEICDGPPRMTC